MKKLNYAVCYITCRYANPLPEGVNQASVRIINSVRRLKLNISVLSFEPLGQNNICDKPVKTYSTLFHESLPGRLTLRKLAYSFNLQAILSAPFLSFLPACDMIHILPPASTIIYAEIVRLLQKFRLKKSNLKIATHVFHPFHPIMKSFTWEGSKTFWMQKLWLLRHINFDQIFCINRFLEHFVRKFVNNKSSVHYVPYPVDVNLFKPASDRAEVKKILGLPADKFLIGYIGQVYAKRGIHILLDGFDMYIKELPDSRLVIATKGLSQEKPHVRSFFNHLKKVKSKNKVIVFNRVLKNVENFYQAMDLMILPFMEPYHIVDPPLVITEALASGVPLITTPAGAINEIISNGKNAICVPIGDATALSKEIIKLASDSHLRSKLASQARKSMFPRSFESIGKLLLKKYIEFF
jgi:glycosyltransferase involved in cell wall biosynthesis